MSSFHPHVGIRRKTEEKVHSGQMSLKNKHFIIKQEVSLSQDFSEPLLNCMLIRLSKRKKQDSDFSISDFSFTTNLSLSSPSFF